MPIERKRRIFHASRFAAPRRGSGLRPTVAVGAVAVLAAGCIALFSLPATLFGRVPAGDAVLTAVSGAVAVVDGETLRLGDRVVRLRGVVAPARGLACRRRGAAFDCGAASANGLAGLLRGRDVTCRLAGRDASGMPQADCTVAGVDLNQAAIAGGWARAMAGMPALVAAEAEARNAGKGLWGTAAF